MSCCVCYDVCVADATVSCASGCQTCTTCFEKHVSAHTFGSLSEADEKGVRKDKVIARGGDIQCPVQDCKHMFTFFDVFTHCSPTTKKNCMFTRDWAREHLIVAKHVQVFMQKVSEKVPGIERDARRAALKASCPDGKQCPKCEYGPIVPQGCYDMQTHAHEAQNNCPRCGHHVKSSSEFKSWDGRLAEETKIITRGKTHSVGHVQVLFVPIKSDGISGYLFLEPNTLRLVESKCVGAFYAIVPDHKRLDEREPHFVPVYRNTSMTNNKVKHFIRQGRTFEISKKGIVFPAYHKHSKCWGKTSKNWRCCESKNASSLFCDVVSSTPTSVKFRPKGILQTIRKYQRLRFDERKWQYPSYSEKEIALLQSGKTVHRKVSAPSQSGTHHMLAPGIVLTHTGVVCRVDDKSFFTITSCQTKNWKNSIESSKTYRIEIPTDWNEFQKFCGEKLKHSILYASVLHGRKNFRSVKARLDDKTFAHQVNNIFSTDIVVCHVNMDEEERKERLYRLYVDEQRIKSISGGSTGSSSGSSSDSSSGSSSDSSSGSSSGSSSSSSSGSSDSSSSESSVVSSGSKEILGKRPRSVYDLLPFDLKDLEDDDILKTVMEL